MRQKQIHQFFDEFGSFLCFKRKKRWFVYIAHPTVAANFSWICSASNTTRDQRFQMNF